MTTANDYIDFETLYAEMAETLVRHIRRQMYHGVSKLSNLSAALADAGINGAQPEDIAQDTWLRVWRAWPGLSFTDDAPARAYVYQVADHLLIDHLRRARVIRARGQVRLTDREWEIAQSYIVDESTDARPEETTLDHDLLEWTRRQIVRVIAGSGSHTAERDIALALAYLDETPQIELAQFYGLSYHNVVTRQARLRRLLRVRLATRLSAFTLGDNEEEIAV